MDLEMIKKLRESLNTEIKKFVDSKEDYYNACVKNYITQNAKYKTGHKFNHPVIGEVVIKELQKHLNYKTFEIYYSTDKDDYLSEEELNKSKKIN